MKRALAAIVDFAGRFPLIVLGLTVAAIVGTWSYAMPGRGLELRTDLLELLPRDSPGFKAFEHQLGRVGGGATLIVIAESKDRHANERFIDALASRLNEDVATHEKCTRACADDACKARCGQRLIAYVESGTKDVRQFFEDNKWLYADLKDLEDADQTLDRQIAIRSGMVEDLLGDDTPAPAPAAGNPPGDKGKPDANEKKSALGMDDYRERWKDKAGKHDDFPTGYFATPEGDMHGLRIVTNTTGLGDQGGATLLARVQAMVAEMKPESFHPSLKVGYAGDVPNAIEEKESLVSDAAWATALAFGLILVGVVVYFRSLWSLVVIGVPPLVGIGCAYTYAKLSIGYVNTVGLFLGAIILGNGINYPIVLLSRYREFRARGLSPEEARRDAVWNAFRAELVGASVASIAYGSLTLTRFRGFSQFGTIGLVGMILVWIAMIPVVPALISLREKIAVRVPLLKERTPKVAADGSRPLARFLAHLTERYPWVFIGLAAALTVVTAYKLPKYFQDPWEYNFDKLGSKGSKVGGAGEWSVKAERVFGGKMNVAGALMLADSPEQVPLVKAQILANDAKDPQGKLIADIATIEDILPGPTAEQQAKLEVLGRIRDRLTPGVLSTLDPAERKRIEEIRPPERLHALVPDEVPALLKRRFQESNGKLTVFYVKYKNEISHSDGRNLLRMSDTTSNVRLPDNTLVQTASRPTIFAEMIHSMERDGPIATAASFLAVVVVVLVATASFRGFLCVIASLVVGVIWMIGGAALSNMKLNYINFIALPITFGIGCEYPFNVFDRARLLGGDISSAVRRVGGAVSLCSFTTIVGYGSLIFNDNQALESFGQLAMAGELATLVGALFLLPSRLHVWKRPPSAVHAADQVMR
ncbi:MAG: MMPL family transporter [Polyangiaceae bacterium]